MTMDTKAGMVFRCSCCNEDKNEQDASHDPELNGPVCPECRTGLMWAFCALKKYMGPTRPLNKNDINDSNYKRFMP